MLTATKRASHAAFFIVMAVTDPDAAEYRRMSMFIVPAETPGIEIIRKNLRKVIEILVKSSIELEEDGGEGDTYLRFINWLQTNHRQLFLDALDNKWNSGYQRCLAQIKQLLPKLPTQILNQRLIFMNLYLNATLSAREAAFDGKKGAHHFWSASYTMDNLIDSVQALLEGKPSVHTAREM